MGMITTRRILAVGGWAGLDGSWIPFEEANRVPMILAWPGQWRLSTKASHVRKNWHLAATVRIQRRRKPPKSAKLFYSHSQNYFLCIAQKSIDFETSPTHIRAMVQRNMNAHGAHGI